MKHFLTVLLAALLASGLVFYATRTTTNGAPAPAATTKESAYNRVMRTGTLRCGYVLYPKIVERDPNTGKLHGFMIEFMDEVGKQLSLKVDWTEQVGIAAAFNGLKDGRYDVMCAPYNQTPNRALATEFTEPFVFFPSFIYARADDARFDNAYDKINAPSVRMALLDGELAQIIRKEQFPKTQPVSLPDITDISQVLLQVAMNKADIAITEPSAAEPFLTNNPGKLKRVAGPPLRIQGVGLDVAVGEEKLKSLLNTTIKELLTIGYVKRLMDKYSTAPGMYYYPARPWGDPSQPAESQS